MQGDDETKELLREIRDTMAAHTKKYDEYLKDYGQMVTESKRGNYEQWTFVGFIIFAAVTLARIVVP